MATEISPVSPHGGGRFAFSFLGSDGKRVTRTAKSRRELEAERCKLLDAPQVPATVRPLPSDPPGSSRWWHALLCDAAIEVREAGASGDTVRLMAAKKASSGIAEAARSAAPFSAMEETEEALQELIEYCEGTLRQLGYRVPDYPKAARGFTLAARGRHLLGGGE